MPLEHCLRCPGRAAPVQRPDITPNTIAHKSILLQFLPSLPALLSRCLIASSSVKHCSTLHRRTSFLPKETFSVSTFLVKAFVKKLPAFLARIRPVWTEWKTPSLCYTA
jgi:hypothetical protein